MKKNRLVVAEENQVSKQATKKKDFDQEGKRREFHPPPFLHFNFSNSMCCGASVMVVEREVRRELESEIKDFGGFRCFMAERHAQHSRCTFPMQQCIPGLSQTLGLPGTQYLLLKERAQRISDQIRSSQN